MAKHIDTATGSSMAISLYKRYYRPTSNLAIHAGAASLLRHVTGDDSITRRPARAWARRSPARIADACMGALTAAVAQRAGTPYRQAIWYADKHAERALTPVAVMALSGFRRTFRPRQIISIASQIRGFGQYVWSGQDAPDPSARTAKIRAEIERLLLAIERDIPPGSLDPFLDYVAAKIVSESVPAASAPRIFDS